MAYVTPKINWATSDGIEIDDLNRIEGNNLANHVDIGDIENELSPKYRAHGGFNNANATSSVTSTAWSHITKSGNDLWNLLTGVGVSLSSDSFRLSNSGIYTGVLSLSYSSDAADYATYIRVYNVTQSVQEGYYLRNKSAVADVPVNTCVPLYISASANDYIRFEMTAEDAVDVTFWDASFHFNRIRT